MTGVKDVDVYGSAEHVRGLVDKESERDKVLDECAQWLRKNVEYYPDGFREVMVEDMLKDLKQ